MLAMSLDKLDQKIIAELFHDARMSHSQLGKRVGTSKEVINYRISRLLKQGIISKFIPLIDFSRLGYLNYRVQLKFNHRDKALWHSFFSAIPQISWLVELQGNWDLVATFWVQSNGEFFEIISKIQAQFKENIQEMLITTVDTVYHLPPNFLLNKKTEKYYKIGTNKDASLQLDSIEIKICRELLKDGRIPLLELARNIDSSATNITYHLKKLLKQKIIIAFIPVINPAAVGFTHFKIMIQLLNPAQKTQLKERLMQEKGTLYITEAYGQSDLEFEFVTQKINELFDLLEKVSNRIPFKKYEIIFNNREVLINEMPLP